MKVHFDQHFLSSFEQVQLGRRRLQLLRKTFCRVGGALPAPSLGAHWQRHPRLSAERIVSIDKLIAGGLSARLPNTTVEPAVVRTLSSVRQQESAAAADTLARRPPTASSLARAIFLPVRAVSADELVQFASVGRRM